MTISVWCSFLIGTAQQATISVSANSQQGAVVIASGGELDSKIQEIRAEVHDSLVPIQNEIRQVNLIVRRHDARIGVLDDKILATNNNGNGLEVAVGDLEAEAEAKVEEANEALVSPIPIRQIDDSDINEGNEEMYHDILTEMSKLKDELQYLNTTVFADKAILSQSLNQFSQLGRRFDFL